MSYDNKPLRNQIEKILGYPVDAFDPNGDYIKIDRVNRAVGEGVMRIQDIESIGTLKARIGMHMETPGKYNLDLPEYDQTIWVNIN